MKKLDEKHSKSKNKKSRINTVSSANMMNVGKVTIFQPCICPIVWAAAK